MMNLDQINQLESDYSRTTDLDYRRAHGQFFTPRAIARFMAEWVVGAKKDKLSILDPASGFGIFPRAISSLNSAKTIRLDLWEIDKGIATALREALAAIKADAMVHQEDFLMSGCSDEYDGIIANPPYYKHHYIPEKQKLHQRISAGAGFQFDLRTNIYCWFLIKAINMLADKGRLAFIVPSEFLNSNYGEKVKEYLKTRQMLTHLIAVNFQSSVFENALTTSVIILIENSPQSKQAISFCRVADAGEIGSLRGYLKDQRKFSIPKERLEPQLKWRNFFKAEASEPVMPFVPLAIYGKFSRGIATGANKFFTLSDPEAVEHRISAKCLRPCITKAIHAPGLHFGEKDFRRLAAGGKKTYLFDGQAGGDSRCKEYICRGEAEAIHKKYLTKNRTPWYALEKRDVSRIWVTVFGRGGVRFIWNDSKCLSLTCFHQYYPKPEMAVYTKALFVFLQTETAHRMIDREKREYGDGLEKLEPGDLGKVLVPDFSKLGSRQIKTLDTLHKQALSPCAKTRREAAVRVEGLITGLESQTHSC